MIDFAHMVIRSEQLMTGACMTDDNDDAIRWTDWAISIAQEWDMSEDMRQAIADAVRENAHMGRALGMVE